MKFLPKFVIRTPLFPLGYRSKDKIFFESIYLSSPSLFHEYEKFNNNLLSEKELQKFNISIYKYQSRSSSRCTPFGLFAGIETGDFSNESQVIFASNVIDTLRRKTRLDMNIVCLISQELNTKDYIKPYLLYYPNKSIYRMGDFYRYVEYYYENNIRKHDISKVDYSEYLELIFTECEDGKEINQIINLLINDEISNEEALNFINELISEQLLVSELEPNVTGEEYFFVLIQVLENIYKKHQSKELLNIISKLNSISELINELDSKIENDITSYKIIHNSLKEILDSVSETNLLQTDLFKKSDRKILNNQIQNSILDIITFLNKITPKEENFHFENFKKRFIDRYGNEETQLLKVLDTETGIGYPEKDLNGINELIDDIIIFNNNIDSSIRWNKLEQTLHRILNESYINNKTEVILLDDDFKDIDFSTDKLPYSISVMFRLLNNESNEIQIETIGGSSAINLLGRFTHGSAEIKEIVKNISSHEQEQVGNSIIAEIVHLPENRVGNVLSRTNIRDYEIAYLAKSSLDREFQIDISDLYLSLKDNNVILRSKKLNRQIIPRLGNAHNFRSKSLPVYHFLCDLQFQYIEKSNLNFNWGSLSNQYDFLPRVKYKNNILFPATWKLKKHHFEKLLIKSTNDIKIAEFQYFKSKHKLPDFFYVVDGDNELLIDTNEEIAILTFIDSLKNRLNIQLEEFLFDVQKSLVKNKAGDLYTNQCITVLLNSNNKLTDDIIGANVCDIQKQFFLGSEWIYYKIYCGIKFSDYILSEKIDSITKKLLEQKYIDKWFFIRYTDPDYHLRFRCHITDNSKIDVIIKLINKELEILMTQGIISKIQTDTYLRELDRYGFNTITQVESLFHLDSEFYLQILENESSFERWQFALLTTNEILNNFNLSFEDRFKIMNKLGQSFFNEHGGGKGLKVQLDNKFRKIRKEIQLVLDENNTDKLSDQLFHSFNKYKICQKNLIDEILNISDQTQNEDFTTLIESLIHMNLNRLFLSKQRTNEFVIYELLTRYYRSEISRIKKKTEEKIGQ